MRSALLTGRTRLIVGLLLVPALGLRVLVPQGFMPGTGADHSPIIQMCHGAGPLPAPANPLPTDPAPERGKHHESPCAFAAAGSTAPPPAAAEQLETARAVEVSPGLRTLGVIPRPLHRAQAARAPPYAPLLA
jgi:hypothetical protein